MMAEIEWSEPVAEKDGGGYARHSLSPVGYMMYAAFQSGGRQLVTATYKGWDADPPGPPAIGQRYIVDRQDEQAKKKAARELRAACQEHWDRISR